MELVLKLLCALAVGGLARGSNLGSTQAAPCRGEGCPSITLYLGPRLGTKVIYPGGTEPRHLTRNGTEREIPLGVEPSSPNDTPPITHLTSIPPTPTNSRNPEKTTSDHPTDATRNSSTREVTSAKNEDEMQLWKILATPDTDEGKEEFDSVQDQTTTSVYDIDSESEESFDEFVQRMSELRKPVPDDGSFFLDFDEQPEFEKEDVVRILPNSPDYVGVLRWFGYQLTGEQVKKTLYSLAAHARERLRSLDLSENLIRDLEPLTFPQELENSLETLRLDDNPIQYLSSSSRFELSRLQRLKVLSLSRTSLRSFPPLLLLSIETLHLQGNLITEVPDTLPSIPTVTELDLSDNWISRINEPISLPRLRILKLNNNSISFIRKDAFINCYNLQQVYLRDNQLTSVPLEMFESPAIFYLNNNPLDGEVAAMMGHEGAVTKAFCASCPGLPSWVYSFTLNSSLLLVALLTLLLAVLAIRTKLTRLPPYMILDEKSPI